MGDEHAGAHGTMLSAQFVGFGLAPDDTNLRVIGRLAKRVEQLMEITVAEGPSTIPNNDDRDRRSAFSGELQSLINRTCQENGSNTPDFMLASYLLECLTTWEKHVQWREQWYGRNPTMLDNIGG